MQIRTGSIAFGPQRGTGPRSNFTDVTFPSNVARATAILTGFTAEFSHGDDHNLGSLDVRLNS
jgi:hypothetical protein